MLSKLLGKIVRQAISEVVKQSGDATKKENLAKSPDFYASNSWKQVRYQALVKHGGKCQACGATAKDNVKIHVDHIKPRSKYPELALDIDNLQVLCENCNIGKLNLSEEDWR